MCSAATIRATTRRRASPAEIMERFCPSFAMKMLSLTVYPAAHLHRESIIKRAAERPTREGRHLNANRC